MTHFTSSKPKTGAREAKSKLLYNTVAIDTPPFSKTVPFLV